ncbi:MAG: sigma 54-interacting transcriptional regulator, partial [Planctomycetota bacterium]
DEGTLREIVEGTAAETGEAFFRKLVQHLAAALHTKCAWVTEWNEDQRRLDALALWVQDKHVDEYVYDVAGTPCEPVIENRQLVHVPDQVIALYPDDPDLAPLGAVSYMGVPLLDTDGTILGHVAVLHDEPLPEDPAKVAVFNIFAGRAAAELRRLRRDRHLREREQKLARLIDSAMDAIIELDGDLAVNRVNSAAEKAFGCSAETMAAESFAAFLSNDARAKLARLMAELERQPEGDQSLWIPDGLEAVRAGGETFAAEATVSRFEMNGQPLFVLILRNISERQEAEARIRSLIDEAAYLRDEIEALQGFDDIIGESDALRRVLVDVDQVAGCDATVLITGETGTGKELIARAIHQRSARAEKPLIKVNCAAIPATLQESEFFGHEQGAFTGATRSRDGRFKLADGGTIFLDEVGELPPDLQAKLLRVLQEGEYEPVGGSRTERVDVRVIAATNRDLEAMVDAGTFRKDLLYRLNVFPIDVPPLRERGEDVVMLAAAFARGFARRSGRPEPSLTADDKAKLRRYDWPGNVRELQNVIERAIITSRDGRLNLERALPDVAAPAAASPASGNATGSADDRILTSTEMRDLERANVVRALEAAGWKISGKGGAAELLGLNPNTLSSRMKSLEIDGARRPQSS